MLRLLSAAAFCVGLTMTAASAGVVTPKGAEILYQLDGFTLSCSGVNARCGAQFPGKNRVEAPVEDARERGAIDVSGFILTDGTLGKIGPKNVLGFEIVLSGDTMAKIESSVASGSLGVFGDASLFATLTSLDVMFGPKGEKSAIDFFDKDGDFLTFLPGSVIARAGIGGSQDQPTAVLSDGFGAQVARNASVPLPAPALLLLSGLALIGWTRRRRAAV